MRVVLMEKIWKIVLISSAGVIVIILTLVVMVHYVPEPPVARIESARAALSEAGKNRAESYSMKLYREARDAKRGLLRAISRLMLVW